MRKIVLLIIILASIIFISGCSITDNECCECKDCPSCDMCCPCK